MCPAYSFQPRFVDPIRDGTKGGTIRAARKIPVNWSQAARDRRPGGHARYSEFLNLYCRQRHPGGFFICQKRCVGVEPIILDFLTQAAVFPDRVAGFVTPSQRDTFARFDGFESWAQLQDFWRSTHGSLDRFEGWHIRWKELP